MKLDKLTDVQSDLLKTKQELLESTGLYAKQKFREHGLIRREPCLWCVTPPEQITAELLLHVLETYKVNLEFEGFHCGAHRQLMHELVGPQVPLWSCCKELAEAETTTESHQQSDAE